MRCGWREGGALADEFKGSASPTTTIKKLQLSQIHDTEPASNNNDDFVNLGQHTEVK